jgi:hypothetical protein
MNHTPIATLIGLVALIGTGCINSSRTVIAPTQRVAVSFASEAASATFHEALGRYTRTAPRAESSTGFSLILINYSRRTVQGPATHFNQAVAMSDHNKDGIITEAEATDFSALLGTKPKPEAAAPSDSPSS